MANALLDLVKKGDRDALNAYLSQQTIGSDNSGMTLNGQPNNALTAMTRQQMQPQMQTQIPAPEQQLPSNTITNASLGYSPMGVKTSYLGGAEGYYDKGGNFISQTPSGYTVNTSASDIAQWKAEGDRARQQQALADQFAKAKVMEQVGKAQQAVGGGVKPTWDAAAGGFVYAPSQESPQGRFVPVQGFTPPAKPLTEYQGQSVMFGTRAADAHNLLNSLEDKVSTTGLNAAHYLENVPLLGSASNAMLSPEQQRVAQAQRNFINAVMRRESGATIGPNEYAEARAQYLPQPGDSPDVIEQKRHNREMVIQGFSIGAGPGGKDINEVTKSNPYAQPAQSTQPTHPADIQDLLNKYK